MRARSMRTSNAFSGRLLAIAKRDEGFGQTATSTLYGACRSSYIKQSILFVVSRRTRTRQLRVASKTESKDKTAKTCTWMTTLSLQKVAPPALYHRKCALSEISSNGNGQGLRAPLGLPDCNGHMLPEDVQRLIEALDDIFFLGAIPPIRFTWQSRDLEPCFRGTRSPVDFNGRTVHTIFMHPVPVPPRLNADLASQRLRNLLYGMIHAFLDEWACRKCRTRGSSLHSAFNEGHSRARFRIASAIDSHGPRILDCGLVDLNVVSEVMCGVHAKRKMNRED